jgi:hypothetical protein
VIKLAQLAMRIVLACGKSQTAKLLFTLAKQSLALTGSKLRAFRR